MRRLGPTGRFAIMLCIVALSILLVIGIVLAFVDAVQTLVPR